MNVSCYVPTNSTISGELTKKLSQFDCGLLGPHLDNLKNIAWLYTSHLGMHRLMHTMDKDKTW